MSDLLVRWLFVCALSVGFADIAAAQLEFDVVGSANRRTPVAVVPFGWEGEGPDAPYDIDDVIAADLNRSGRFRPIPENDMLQKPTASIDVDFDDWSILGVEAVVIGKITQTGANAYSVQFQAFDVFNREQLVGYRMPASRGNMRRVAHRLVGDRMGVGREGVQAELETMATNLVELFPEDRASTVLASAGFRPRVDPAHEVMVGDITPERSPYTGDLQPFVGTYGGPARGGEMQLRVEAADGGLTVTTVMVGDQEIPADNQETEEIEFLDGTTFVSGQTRYTFESGVDSSPTLRFDGVGGYTIMQRR